MLVEIYVLLLVQLCELVCGGMVWVMVCGFLVCDLDEILCKVLVNFDWEFSGLVEYLCEEGYCCVCMGFIVVNSVIFDVIEVIFWNIDVGYYLNNWGLGLYYICIGVNDLVVKVEDLCVWGIVFEWIELFEVVGG